MAEVRLPDAETDPAGFLLAVADRVEMGAMTEPDDRGFFLAVVALWRVIGEVHVQGWTAPKVRSEKGEVVVVDEPQCAARCGAWPCVILVPAVGAARAYLTGAGG